MRRRESKVVEGEISPIKIKKLNEPEAAMFAIKQENSTNEKIKEENEEDELS